MSERLRLKLLPHTLTVCRLPPAAKPDPDLSFCFFARTDEEVSLVCLTEETPSCASPRSDGWCGLRVEGTLDFSLVGILSRLSSVLSDAGISIFALSTYNTDYILIQRASLDLAVQALSQAGYDIDL